MSSRHWILIGPRGSGKTAVGRKLADRLKLPFLDTDALVMEKTGKTIRALFDEHGEFEFRLHEVRAVREAILSPPSVLSAGGGAVLSPVNAHLFSERGRVLFLYARPEILANRLELDPATVQNRPRFGAGPLARELERVLEERRPLYETVSHARFDTSDLDVDGVVDRVLSHRFD